MCVSPGSTARHQEFDDLFRSVRLVQAALEQVHGAEAAMDPDSEDSLRTTSGVQFEGVDTLWQLNKAHYRKWPIHRGFSPFKKGASFDSRFGKLLNYQRVTPSLHQ